MINSFIGRQPILDVESSTFGYELLFRDGAEKLISNRGDDSATLNVIDNSTLSTDLNTLSGNKKVFINFTEKLLLEGFWSALPNNSVIIELLENINPSNDVYEVCKTIKQNGYMLAIDDFRYSSKWDPIIEIADIIKIDIKSASVQEVEAYAKKFNNKEVKLLAEKVETLQEFQWTEKIGYKYFQGYYFGKPEIIKSEQIPTSRMTKLRLINEVNKPDFEFSKAEALLKHDPGLILKLLRYVNSAALGLRNEVSGIRQALTMIGQRELKKWISILAVSAFTEKKPKELMHTVVKRGQFCELLAQLFGYRDKEAQSLFLIGMFSLLDAIIDLPMEEALEQIPLSSDVKETIQGNNTPYKDILNLAKTFETGEWGKMNFILKKHKLVDKHVIEAHIQAIEWTENFID